MEKYLDRIDNYFEQKSQSETSILFLATACVIFFLVYILFFDVSTQYLKDAETRHADVDTKLADTKYNIKKFSSPDGLDTEYKIKQDTHTLNLLKAVLDTTQKSNLYFDNKLRELSFLLFNDENWANFLDNLVLLARNNNIKISKITNDRKNTGYQKVEQFLNVNLSVSGNFKDMVNYINQIEESKLVVDMNKIDINSSSVGFGLEGNFGISVWGMKY